MAQQFVPVTQWSTLRVLLRVVVKACQVCQGEHEGTLVELSEKTVPVVKATFLTVDWVAAWVVVPAPPCVPAGADAVGRTAKRRPQYVITPLAVDEGRVFVVVEGDEQADVTTRTREKVDSR